MWKMMILGAFRAMRRDRLHSVVTVASLAVGMACFILFFFSWQYEHSFDRHYPGARRIVRVSRSFEVQPGRSQIADQVGALGPAMARTLPEVEAATRWYSFSIAAIRPEGGDLRPVPSVYAVDREFFRVFPIRPRAGDGARALENPGAVLLSRRTARALFGSEEVLGRALKLAVSDRTLMRARFEAAGAEGPEWDERDYTVAAILPDPPSNSTHAFDILIPIEAAARLYEGAGYESVLDTWAFGWVTTFARLRPGASLAGLASRIDDLKRSNSPAPPPGESSFNERTVLTPLRALHLADPALGKYLYIFGTIAAVVLLLACLNAVNLTTSRVFSRSKEIGLKKVVGAGRRQLVVQFLVESLTVSTIALVLALAAVGASLGYVRYLSGRGLVVGEIGPVALVAGLAAIAVFTAAAAGGYPAYLLSAVRPAELFTKDRTPRSARSSVRKGLIFAQFAIAGTLLIMALTVSRQMAYIAKADQGIDLNGLTVVRWDPQATASAGGGGEAKLEVLKTELLRHPAIQAVSGISQAPPRIDSEIDVKPEGVEDSEKTAWRYLSADEDFPAVFGVRLAEGRFFSRDFPSDANTAAVINESGARLLGPGAAVGKRIQAIIQKGRVMRFDYTVVGVVRDFHTRPLHEAMEPLLILPGRGKAGALAVRLRPGAEAAGAAFIQDRAKAVYPNVPPRLTFVKDDVLRAYAVEERLMSMTRSFSAVAVFIGCIGLFGLAAFGTAQRRKEMGIRKVLGASSSDLFGAFARDLAMPVVLSNLAAWPAAFVLARSWLGEFAFRTTLPAWTFLAGGTAILAFALLAIAGHLTRAARENPVESLRQE